MSHSLPRLYEDLQREYDLTLDRRKTLTSQASNLLSFAGIIETVLIGLIVTLATSKDAHAILLASSYYNGIIWLAGIGFLSYILTAILALFAFREPMWMRIPEMPDLDPLVSIAYFYLNKAAYNEEMFAKQLSYATDFHQKTNDRKYAYLSAGFVSLLIGIIATAIAGLSLLATVR